MKEILLNANKEKLLKQNNWTDIVPYPESTNFVNISPKSFQWGLPCLGMTLLLYLFIYF